jgi:hypothetical protein
MDALRFVLVCLAGWMNREQQLVIDYLEEEVKILRGEKGFLLGYERLIHDQGTAFCKALRGHLREAE